MRILPNLTFCALVSMLAWYVPAQGAVLSGVVADAGEPVVKAEVMLVNADNNLILDNAFTDTKGAFRFAVKPGVFNIGTFKPDHSTAWTKGVVVGKLMSRFESSSRPRRS